MREEEIVEEVINYYEMIKINRPLIHQITNYVSANDQANITLAVGARPIMAEHPDELEEIIGQADSLLLNLGTVDEKRERVLIRAAELAKKYKIPVVMDPVGVGASRLRKKLAFKLLELGNIDIIKGNAGEIFSLSNIYIGNGKISGVDYLFTDSFINKETISNFREFSRKYNLVLVMTGQEDIVIGHSYLVRINNGNIILGNITGSGCMVSSLIASHLAVGSKPLIAAVAGITLMNISGQLAAKKARGPGSFRFYLLDEVANLSVEKIVENIRLKLSILEK